jgi:hypothetical protein
VQQPPLPAPRFAQVHADASSPPPASILLARRTAPSAAP